jgi:hypothetical protein
MHIHGGGLATLGQSNQNGWINASKVCFLVYMLHNFSLNMNLIFFFLTTSLIGGINFLFI